MASVSNYLSNQKHMFPLPLQVLSAQEIACPWVLRAEQFLACHSLPALAHAAVINCYL